MNLKFKWTSIPNAINYEIQFYSTYSNSGILTLTDTTYQVENLLSNQQYYWKVRAKYIVNDEEAFTPWFGPWSFYTKDTASVLPATNLIYPSNGNLKLGSAKENIIFKWNYVKDANSYQLQIAYDSLFQDIKSDRVISDTTLVYSDTILNGQTLYWRIKTTKISNSAIERNGNWSNINNFTLNYVFTTYPRCIAPANGAVNQPEIITLVWSSVPNVEIYRIKIIYPENSIFDEELFTSDTTVYFYYTDTNSTYQWYVYAQSSDGYYSSFQDTPYSFSTGNYRLTLPWPDSPSNGAAINSSNTIVTWNTVNNAESYRFQLAEQNAIMPKVLIAQNMLFSENSTIVMDTIMANNSINLSLNGNEQTYYWRVYAKLKNGDSTCWTNPWEFTVNATNYVEQNQANLAIQVYTNHNLLTVRQEEKYFEQAKFEIYNVSGELVKDLGVQNFNNDSMEFNISELSSGKYWLKISSDKYSKYFGFNITTVRQKLKYRKNIL